MDLVVPFIVHWTPVLIVDVAGGLEAGYTNFGAPLPMGLVMLLPWFVLFSLEEVGWRGFALPRMQERRSALSPGFLLGIGWGFWHMPFAFGDTKGQFGGAENVAITATDAPDLSQTTSLEGAFRGALSLTTVPNMGNWDTSSVTDMVYMFSAATSFN